MDDSFSAPPKFFPDAKRRRFIAAETYSADSDDNEDVWSNSEASFERVSNPSNEFNFPVPPEFDEDSLCIICDEHADILRQQAQENDWDNYGIITNINNDRELVFALEQCYRGHKPDKYIFQDMLTLRRKLIEEKLALFNYKVTPWTMQMLQRHYQRHDDPNNNHQIDHIRDIQARILDAQKRNRMLSKAIIEADADTGMPKLRVDVAREARFNERHLVDLYRDKRKAMAEFKVLEPALERRLSELRELGLGPRRTANELVQDAYDVGGY
jgi:hypothetical protein